MKKLLLISTVLATLSGCASMQYAGTASYSVKPIVDTSGGVVCCAVEVHNGKEIANLEAHIYKQGDSYTVDLKETGVAAFAGQAIAAGALKEAVDGAVKAAVSAALAPILPALLPAAGAALSAPGIGAAVVGAGTVVVGEKVLAK